MEKEVLRGRVVRYVSEPRVPPWDVRKASGRGPVSQRTRGRRGEREELVPPLPLLQRILFFFTFIIRGGGTVNIRLKFLLKTVTRGNQERVMCPSPRFQRLGTKGHRYLRTVTGRRGLSRVSADTERE